MKYVMEAFSVLFVLILNISLCVTVLNVSAQTAAAKRFTADVVAEIENSNFNETVMESCKSRATEAGYDLEILSGEYGDEEIARVRLFYPYRLPLFSVAAKKTTEAIAR